MEGKRFGLGLVAGLLIALALVTVSGGLGSTPLTVFNVNAVNTGGAAEPTSTVSSTTVVFSATTTAAETTSSTLGGTSPSLNSNGTSPVTSSSSTISETSSVETATATSTTPQWGGVGTTNTGSGTTYSSAASVADEPSRLASIAKQPIVSNAEILAPVLIAFLLGAFLYRVAVQEREKAGSD